MRTRAMMISRIAALFLVTGLLVACDTDVSPSDAGAEGQILPVFAVRDKQDRLHDFSLPPSRLRLLNLWAIWCPPCREEMPSLQRLANDSDAADLQVIGLAVEDDAYLLDELLRKYQITFPIMRISREQAESRLGLREYPLSLLVGADGRILARLTGAFDWDDPAIKTLLQRLAQQQRIDSAEIQRIFRHSQQAVGKKRE